MKRVLDIWLVALALIALVAVVACAPTATPATRPEPTSSSSALITRPDWQERWEQTLAAARNEKEVTVYGELGSIAKAGLMGSFKNRFGIEMETVIGTGPDVASRYVQEAAKGIYLADVLFNGDMTFLNVIKPIGVLGPMEPHLILPEVKDSKVWPEGRIPFLDRDRALTARPPHPNAATILVNWLLTAEAGGILSQAWGAPASRLDVPAVGVDPSRLPATSGKMYIDDEELVLQNPKTQEVARAIFGHLIK